MKKNTKLIAGIIAILLGVGIIVAAVVVGNNLNNKSDNNSSQTADDKSCPMAEVDGAQTLIYDGVAGETAFETLKATCDVESDSSEFGEFVTSIDGVAAGTTHFWGFYVNDKMAEVGASSYTAKEGDEIKWVLTKIDTNY